MADVNHFDAFACTLGLLCKCKVAILKLHLLTREGHRYTALARSGSEPSCLLFAWGGLYVFNGYPGHL